MCDVYKECDGIVEITIYFIDKLPDATHVSLRARQHTVNQRTQRSQTITTESAV